jgi:hypothetical protein
MVDLDTSSSEMQRFLERYATDYSALQRSYNIPMLSLRSDKMKQFLLKWQRTLESVDFEPMGQDGRIDYLLFKNHLQYRIHRLSQKEIRISEISYCLPGWQAVIGLEENMRKMEALDAKEAAGVLAAFADSLKQTKGQIESGDLLIKKTHALRTAVFLEDIQEVLSNWYTFYNGYDPLFTWWMDDPYHDLEQVLTEYAEYLREDVIGTSKDDGSKPVTGDPIGQQALLNELQFEFIPYSPEELLAIGEKEYAWCESEMIKASRELGYGDNWLKSLEHVKTLHVAPGEQPDLIKNLALESIEFLEKHDLLTIPALAKETWRIEMMSPERQLVNPFFTGGEVISVSFPTNTMAYEQKLMSMRGNNVHFSRATVHHELIPGHHLQGFMRSRYRTHRRIFSTPFWVEGWALYWEMLFWDYNFAQSPENKIGMLFWRMHRCARIIFSISFHLEKMTAQECIDFLVSRVGHELNNATAEVRRSFETSYPPLYQCAYMLGGLQIRALHKELVKSGKMTDRDFHDAVLKQNAIPIELIRAALINQPVSKNYTSEWRFYD